VVVAKDRNELVDDSMLRFESRILTHLAVRSGRGSSDPDRPQLEPPNLSSTIYGSLTTPERRGRWLPGVAARFSDGLIRLNGWRVLRRLQRGRNGQ
jgi:hypothetical protein